MAPQPSARRRWGRPIAVSFSSSSDGPSRSRGRSTRPDRRARRARSRLCRRGAPKREDAINRLGPIAGRRPGRRHEVRRVFEQAHEAGPAPGGSRAAHGGRPARTARGIGNPAGAPAAPRRSRRGIQPGLLSDLHDSRKRKTEDRHTAAAVFSRRMSIVSSLLERSERRDGIKRVFNTSTSDDRDLARGARLDGRPGSWKGGLNGELRQRGYGWRGG